MNTLTKGFAKRVLSALLATIMVFSLGVVGLSSASAANVELEETGYVSTDSVYCFNSISGIWNQANSSIKMEWNSDFGLHEFLLNDVSIDQDIFFRFYCSNDGNTIHAYNSDEDISSNISYENNNWTYGPTYTNNIDVNKNWKLDLSKFSSYDTVDVYLQLKSSGMSVYVTDGKTGSTTGVTGQDSTYYLPGTFNSWNTSSDPMKYDTDVKNVTTTLLLSAGTHKFKVFNSKNSLWYGKDTTLSPTPSASASTTLSSSGTDTNLVISANYPGYYKFTFDTTTNKVTVAYDKAVYDLSVDASAAETEVYSGTDIEIIAEASEKTATVTYKLKNSDGDVIDTNTDGIFEVDTSNFAAGTYTYTVEASCTVSNVSYTATSEVITVTVLRFGGLIISLVNPPTSVEYGDSIDFTVKPNTDSEVTYTLKDGAGNVLATNTTGIFSQATTAADKGTTKTFTVEASTYVNATTYTATPVTFNVSVTEISNTRNVNIYFKSTSTKGFAPVATVTGMYETLTDVKMTKAQYIISNSTETADYWWYVVSTKVSETNTSLSFNVKSSRYDMEVTAYFDAVEGVDDYYFAVDNLYYTDSTNDVVNMTDWEPLERNYCVNAVHMVYDAEHDTEEELNAFAAKCVLAASGDVNYDDSVNIKDATYLQKSLVDLAELGTVGEKVSDVDDDGVNTIKDATAIQKAVAGL